MWKQGVAVGCLVSAATMAARADLLVGFSNVGIPGAPLCHVERYSNSGIDLGLVFATGDEELFGPVLGSDGNLYTLPWDVGAFGIYQTTLGGQALAHSSGSPSLWQYDGSMAANQVAVRGNYVYLSNNSFSGGGTTGILKFDRSTLNYLGNAVPMTDPVGGSFSPVVGDVVAGPDGYIYVSTTAGISKYLQIPSTGALVKQSFAIATPGVIAFRPGDTSIYVGGADGTISQYDSTGAFVRILTTAGGSDFAFGDDGYLYVAWHGVERFNANTGAFVGTVISVPSYSSYFLPERIAFVPAPEPASLALLGMGAVGMLVRRRKGKPHCQG